MILVSKRAKQLLKGSEPTIPARGNKYIVNSLREVAAGDVYFDIDVSEGSADEQIEKGFC